MAEYRATFREAFPFYLCTGLLAVLLLVLPLAQRHAFGPSTIVGASLFALLVWVRLRLKVKVSAENLDVSGLVGRWQVKWAEIDGVVSSSTVGYWRGRTSGPLKFSFLAGPLGIPINFKFFSRSCFDDVTGHLPKAVWPARQGDV
jgi:hypothetical protein